MLLLKRFLTESKDVDRSSRLWNMIASMLVAFQSVILLIIMSRTVGKSVAGIYIIGNTYSNLFVSIGKFGTRSFQVSDVKREYKFYDYRYARTISCITMIAISMGFVFYSYMTRGYSQYKTFVLICICLYKVPDAIEDVYHGEYQKNGRLDVAAKSLALRMMLTVIGLTLLLVITRDLLWSFVITTLFTFVLMIVFLVLTKRFLSQEGRTEKRDIRNIGRLLISTLPLAMVAFLTLYINSMPRNSIDKYMSNEEQSIFGYIAMPVFVVELLVMFLLNPVYYKLSCMWNENRLKDFRLALVRFIMINTAVTLICFIGAFFLGIPVLSAMYNTELSGYKTDLMILMVCSGMYSFAALLYSFMIIMRKQKMILFAYMFVAIGATFTSNPVVKKNGIRGASLLYLSLLSLLSMLFVIEFIIAMIQKRKMINEVGESEN